MLHVFRKSFGVSCRRLPYVFGELNQLASIPRRTFVTSGAVFDEPKDTKAKEKQPNDQHQQAQSILTDDMLARAGVEVEESKEFGKQSASGSESETTSGETVSGSGKKRRHRKTSTEVKREKYANLFYIFSFAGLLGTGLYMARDWEAEEPEDLKKGVGNGYTPSLMYQRFKSRFDSIFTFFQEPPFPDLLPPPPPPPYQRPLTLVLPLEDFLIHSEWSQKNGWRTAKRPGADYFLGYLSQYYEIVLFSSNYMMHSEKIAEKLDPIHAFITYNLFKEHCVYKDGIHIKDLSHLNRDLGKTIIIDTDANAFKLQPENAIHAEPWDGKADHELLTYIPFLEYLVTQPTEDIRPILNSFSDRKNIPLEFSKRVDKLRDKFNKEQSNRANEGWLLKLLGIGITSKQSKFPLDLIRDEGEKNYVRFMKIVEEEKEKLKLQQEKMGAATFTLKDYVEGNIPSPEEQMKIQLEKQKEFEEMYEREKLKKKQQQQQQQQV